MPYKDPEKRKEYFRRWRKDNNDYINMYDRKRNAERKETKAEGNRQWLKANREYNRLRCRRYRQKEKCDGKEIDTSTT